MNALITGTSSGIGKAIAQALLAEGWRVKGFDIAPPAIEHERFQAARVDLCDGAAAEHATASAGSVDALVHAAGVLRVGSLGQLDARSSELMWRLHVESVTRIANVVLPAMVAARSGRVVLIGSRVAQGKAGRSQYAATKAALIAMARSWAAEVIAAGVTVNVVSPAATETAMLDDPARRSESRRTMPRPPACRMARDRARCAWRDRARDARGRTGARCRSLRGDARRRMKTGSGRGLTPLDLRDSTPTASRPA